jgi:hypothetical protein
VPDPPDGEAVSVAVWPLSIVTGGTETVGVEDPLTVTVTAEVTITGVEALSVTSSSKCHIPAVDKVPVDTLGVSLVLHANGELKSL